MGLAKNKKSHRNEQLSRPSYMAQDKITLVKVKLSHCKLEHDVRCG